MNFSMPSFFIGVGTVVGAIALGFGGGVVLTNSAVKDSAATPRVERVAHPDVPAAKIVARADAPRIGDNAAANPPPAADGTEIPVKVVPLNAQASSVPPTPQPVAQPVVATGPAPMEQVVAKDVDQLSAGEVERQRRAERRLTRKKLEAERRARAQAVAKMRQQQFEVREQAKTGQAKSELAFDREDDSGFSFFGRPNPPQRVERD
jgi:hypothetical protein